MVLSNGTSRAREDEWLNQLPALPTSTSQQADGSVLGKPKHQRSNPPVYPHPQPGNGNQLPPIRNLVPGLWEPGTSKSSQQVLLADGKNGSLVYPLRLVGPAWSNKIVCDRLTSCPQLETNFRESESIRDYSRPVNESKKRPPPSPIERADDERTAPSNSVINSSGGNNVQKLLQTSKQIGEKPDARPRSSSEAAKPAGERPGNGSQSSHQQEILRDPVSEHWAIRPSRQATDTILF